MVPVVKLPAGQTAQSAKGDLVKLEQKMSQVLPGSRVSGYGSTGSKSFVSADGRTAFAIACIAASTAPLPVLESW